MKIGFDAKRLFNNFTGLGNYSRTLVQNLQSYYPEHQYSLFTPKTKDSPRTRSFFDQERFQIVQPPIVSTLWRSYFMTHDIQSHNIDIYHGLSHEIPFGIKKSDAKIVVTIHDLIYLQFASDYGWWDRKVYDRKFRYACQHADVIVAISQQTKSDIVKFYGTPAEKIKVIYQNCDPIFSKRIHEYECEAVRQKHSLPERYFLFVGSVIGRKNLDGVISALKKIPKDQQIPLVVIGQGRLYQRQVENLIRSEGLGHLVKWAIDIPFSDFPAIYKSATSLVLPAYFEGFGIPILEAMTVGTPVITSNRSAPAELIQDAGRTVDPDDIQEIANAMIELLSEPELASEMIIRGKRRSADFKPDILSQQLMNLYLSL